jgi:hypothetical protein
LLAMKVRPFDGFRSPYVARPFGSYPGIDKELYGSKDRELKDISIARGAGKRCSEAPKNWRQWLSVCLADHQRELAKEETRRADQFVNLVSSNPAGRRAMKENLP